MNLEDELAKAQEELAALRIEYEQYVYVVSHDLIAPLRQIEGFAHIVYDKHANQFDDKTKRHLQLIVSGAQKGRRILDALMEYSRLNTRCEPFSAINCQEIIDEVINDLSSVIETSGAKITCTDIPVVVGDQQQLYQVFYHLMHNALHYHISDSVPTLSVSVSGARNEWQFCVKDNAMGVPDQLKDKIFTVLKRAVSDKEFSGIGMGLSIARKIVQRHGGRIWVASEQDVGTSFCFTLAKDLPHE